MVDAIALFAAPHDVDIEGESDISAMGLADMAGFTRSEVRMLAMTNSAYGTVINRQQKRPRGRESEENHVYRHYYRYWQNHPADPRR